MNAVDRTMLAVSLALLVGGCASTVYTEIFIPAPPERVWSVLTDAKGYAAWNPVLVKAEGNHAKGETVAYLVREPDGSENVLKATVERSEPGKILNQTGGVWGILTFNHRWLLKPVKGGTHVVQCEEYKGMGVPFFDESWIGPAYRRANEGLKKRVLEQLEAEWREETPGKS